MVYCSVVQYSVQYVRSLDIFVFRACATAQLTKTFGNATWKRIFVHVTRSVNQTEICVMLWHGNMMISYYNFMDYDCMILHCFPWLLIKKWFSKCNVKCNVLFCCYFHVKPVQTKPPTRCEKNKRRYRSTQQSSNPSRNNLENTDDYWWLLMVLIPWCQTRWPHIHITFLPLGVWLMCTL